MAISSSKTIKWLTDIRFVVALYVVLSLAATVQSIVLEPKLYEETGYAFPRYNNYLIFKQSFNHLLEHRDLYKEYPSEHWDFYKYTPTFSLVFGPLAILPDAIGLFLWNLLNGLVLALAIYALPGLTNTQRGWIALLGCIETMTALQNSQSNGLIAALLLLAFSFCERKQFFVAILCLVGSVFIKPFGIVGFALLAFYPGKFKLAVYALIAGILMWALPLVVITPEELIRQYQSWLSLLSLDHAAKNGLSVIGWLHTWFSIAPNKNLVTLMGALVFMIPFLRIQSYSQWMFRMLALCSILIWIVIFNHMAESPTFVIAMTGASIWYFSKQRGRLDTILYILVFISISLTPTDLFPRSVREEWVKPYVLKAVPSIVLWTKIIFEMMTLKPENPIAPTLQPIRT